MKFTEEIRRLQIEVCVVTVSDRWGPRPSVIRFVRKDTKRQRHEGLTINTFSFSVSLCLCAVVFNSRIKRKYALDITRPNR
jgi:hypothetical protein